MTRRKIYCYIILLHFNIFQRLFLNHQPPTISQSIPLADPSVDLQLLRYNLGSVSAISPFKCEVAKQSQHVAARLWIQATSIIFVKIEFAYPPSLAAATLQKSNPFVPLICYNRVLLLFQDQSSERIKKTSEQKKMWMRQEQRISL